MAKMHETFSAKTSHSCLEEKHLCNCLSYGLNYYYSFFYGTLVLLKITTERQPRVIQICIFNGHFLSLQNMNELSHFKENNNNSTYC